MTDEDYDDHEVFISVNDLSSRKLQISAGIHHFMDKNKEKIIDSFSNICEDGDFLLLLIKDIFLHLKNETNLLYCLNIHQLKEIPPIIYNIVKESFSNQRLAYIETEFLEKINNLYGFIYVSTNTCTEKKYVGQTTRTIEIEWNDILNSARSLERKRNGKPTQIIVSRYIFNSILKYDKKVWDLKLIDIAYNKSELNDKEDYYIIDLYNSIAPNGYNLKRGGEGGKHNPITREKIGKAQSEVWDRPGYRDMQSKIQSEVWDKSGYRDMQSKIQSDKWDRPGYRENQKKKQSEVWDRLGYRDMQSKTQSNVWNRPGYRDMQSKIQSDKWDRPGYRENQKKKLSDVWNKPSGKKKKSEVSIKVWNKPGYKKKYCEARKEAYKNDPKLRARLAKASEKAREVTRIEIKDKRQFLIDIKKSKIQKDIIKKYPFKTKDTLNKRIKEILGPLGIQHYSEAKKFFQHNKVEDVLKKLKDLGHIF